MQGFQGPERPNGRIYIGARILQVPPFFQSWESVSHWRQGKGFHPFWRLAHIFSNGLVVVKNHQLETKDAVSTCVHPWRLTWNIIMEVWKIMFLSKRVICRFHVNLPGVYWMSLDARVVLSPQVWPHWKNSPLKGAEPPRATTRGEC